MSVQIMFKVDAYPSFNHRFAHICYRATLYFVSLTTANHSSAYKLMSTNERGAGLCWCVRSLHFSSPSVSPLSLSPESTQVRTPFSPPLNSKWLILNLRWSRRYLLLWRRHRILRWVECGHRNMVTKAYSKFL